MKSDEYLIEELVSLWINYFKRNTDNILDALF